MIGHSVLFAACRWLRQKLDIVERFAQHANRADRKAQVPGDLADARYLASGQCVNVSLEGYVGDASTQAAGCSSLEEYHRSLSGAQQRHFPYEIDVGRQFIGHLAPLDENKQVSLTAATPTNKGAA